MVLAQADIVARVPLRAALTHDDVAGANGLAAELLHAEAFALTVAAVAGRSACFLMCHVELLLRRFLGRALSRCSIFCRPGFGLGLGRGSFLGRGLVSAGGFLVRRSRAFGRRSCDLAGLVLVGRRRSGFVSTRSGGLAGAGLALRRAF